MLNLLSLSQLEHKARIEDNSLALAILEKLDDEVNEAVEDAVDSLTPNDADYSYKIYDAVQAVEWALTRTLQGNTSDWYRTDDSNIVEYVTGSLHKDCNPYNNHVSLTRHKGSEQWLLTVNSGQYGECVDTQKIIARGFKEAQDKAGKEIARMIGRGVELNIG